MCSMLNKWKVVLQQEVSGGADSGAGRTTWVGTCT